MLDSPQFLVSPPCICCGTVLYFSRLDEGDWALAWKCLWGTGGCRWWEREIFFIFMQQVANTKKISTVYPWLHFQSTCAKNKNYGLHWWGFYWFVCGLKIPSPQTMNKVDPQLDPYTEEPFTNDMWKTLFFLWPPLVSSWDNWKQAPSDSCTLQFRFESSFKYWPLLAPVLIHL